MDIFSFDSYLDVIEDQIRSASKKAGYLAKLASAAGVQRSYFSRVLSDEVCLTPDHGAGLADFWNLGPQETKYFLNLIHLRRAGTSRLKRIVERDLREMRDAREARRGRPRAEELLLDQKYLFCSSWLYAAIHAALETETLNTPEVLARRFGVSVSVVDRAFREMARVGILEEKNSKWKKVSGDLVRVDGNSKEGELMASTWRLHRIHSPREILPDECTVTGVFPISPKDSSKIRALLMDAIENAYSVITPSPSEELYFLNLDWMRV